MLNQEFELGSYTGQLEGGVPHGAGQMVYKEDDALDREIYDGHWEAGSQSGQGIRTQMPATDLPLYREPLHSPSPAIPQNVAGG